MPKSETFVNFIKITVSTMNKIIPVSIALEPDTRHFTSKNDSVSAEKSTERKIFMRGRNLFKIVLVGEMGTGKTAIMVRYIDQKYEEIMDLTIGVEFGACTVKRNNVSVKLQLWDTGGQEAFRKVVEDYYRGEEADAIIVVYDCTRRFTFDSVERYYKVSDNYGVFPILLKKFFPTTILFLKYHIYTFSVIFYPTSK